jgi:hypothetical protein
MDGSVNLGNDLRQLTPEPWTRYPAIAGITLAVPIIAIYAMLPDRLAVVGAALLLVAVAAVYLGFALAGDSLARIATEFVGVGIFGSGALIGVDGSPWVIPAALALHPVWDWLHHPRALGGVPRWYPTACVLFDLPLAGWIAWRLCF